MEERETHDVAPERLQALCGNLLRIITLKSPVALPARLVVVTAALQEKQGAATELGWVQGPLPGRAAEQRVPIASAVLHWRL